MQLETDYSRGANNEISQEMHHKKVRATKRLMQLKVKALIDGKLCTKEIADQLGKFLHQISGRFSELKANGEIKVIGRKEFEGSTYSVYDRI